MSGARALLLALLLARLPARGLGPAPAAAAELAAGAARRAAPRSQDAAGGRAAAAAAPGSAAQLPAAGPRRGRPAPPLRRRPRAAGAALRRPDRHRPPGVSGLRGPAASRRSGGSRYEAAPGGSGVPAPKDVAVVKSRLQTVSEELSQCSHSIFDFQGVLNGILSELVKHRQQVHEDKSIQQIKCCVEKMQLIYKQFKKARTCLRLSYNEEQIHKLDKVNLGHLARKVLSIFQDDCVQRYQEALTLHGSRMRKVYEIKKHLKKLSNRISACSVEMTECQDCLHSALDRILQTEKQSLAPVPPAPSPVHLSQARQEMAFRMQELLDQMRSVTCDLQFNNGIIERLNRAAPTPGV